MSVFLRPSVACLALLLALSACAPEREGVRLRVSGERVQASAIARVALTVSPGNGPVFTPFTVSATRNATGWEAFVGSVPSGAGRVFAVEALDAASARLLVGETRADVAAGAELDLLVILQEPAAPPPVASRPPTITSLAVWSPVVEPGGEALLRAVVTGAPGELIEYAWTSTPWCGGFGAPDAAETTWSSVGVFPATLCPITFRATGASGGSVEVVVPVSVSSGAPAP